MRVGRIKTAPACGCVPELPEVETCRRALAPLLKGRSLTAAEVRWPRAAATPLPVAGRRIVRLERRGKFLLLRLDDGWLVVHLRMTGRLVVAREPPARTTIAFGLDGGDWFCLVDMRKFGRAWLVARASEVVGHLGPEPLSRNFTAARFEAMLAPRQARLKPLLLDQRFLAGLGNIYVDESLHAARIHPLRTAASLSVGEVRLLHRHIRRILRAAIAAGGTTVQDFAGPDGAPGRFRDRLQVFRRTGEPCYRCGTAVERSVVAQRGTHSCPRCQPL